VTLFDLQPSMGHLTQLALAASNCGLGAIDPEYDSVDGAIRFRDFIGDPINRKGLGNPDLRLIGFVINRVRGNLGAHTYQIEGLPETLGAELVWEPYIPERATGKDAADAAVPLRLLGTAPGRQQADLYTKLAARFQKEIAN
jgi:cellulose biosynthesis protein BcsQ